MPADLETPVSAFLKLQEHGAKLLLESVEGGTNLGRYSFIGVSPKTRVELRTDAIHLHSTEGEIRFAYEGTDPLKSLKELLGSFSVSNKGDCPPLLGGLVGYFSYDMVRKFEPVNGKLPDPLDLPLGIFYLVDTLLVFDHVQHKLKIMTLSEAGDETEANGTVERLMSIIRSPLNSPAITPSPSSTHELISNFTKERFCASVQKTKEFIRAGEVFQLVLSQRLTGRTEADPFTIYRALRMLNPSPYLFYLDLDQTKLIGSSPEALVRLKDGRATVRPIAGTRPRGNADEVDRQLAEELLADEKERAEHVMLVDLGRNDLGRCCEYGSVTVDEFMNVERYSHVMHMTSNVTGRLKRGLDQFDLFRAAFPAGTVSGAPKIRAMQLIDELEQEKRGPYAGAVGYFSLSGDMDWCIAIRTIVMKNRQYYLQAGAGIVADSVPEREYQECLDKLAALKRAIQNAEEGF
jgi:anthranilate synthase component 1